MRIWLEKPGEFTENWSLHFGDDVFFNPINEWKQLYEPLILKGTKYNWITFHPIHIMLEDDIMSGGYEFEFIVMGFGIRTRWNYGFEDSEVGNILAENLREEEAKERNNERSQEQEQ